MKSLTISERIHFLSFTSSNKKTCTDLDECLFGLDGCSDVNGCVNTDGSYVCTCGAGKQLGSDQRTCIGKFCFVTG